MRLHRLRMTAFGPFAGTEEVDFDRLADAGLFLLHGPTGAGKTTVLDAVCFALYGRVPGARAAVSGRLRSDHAASTVAPEVVCEFSVGARRLEVTRSPEWQRPKRRGSGTIREQAHVLLRHWDGEAWQPVTNRLDEAAEELQQLLGMGVDAFTKLVLLPQGEFAAFLRASAEERRPILERLFGTQRFADVERWLADRRRELAREMVTVDSSTQTLLARAEQAAAGLVGDPADADAPADAELLAGPDAPADAELPAGPDAVAARIAELASRAATQRADATERAEQEAAAVRVARARLGGLELAADAARRRNQLTDQLASLRAEAPEQAARRRRLAAAATAAVLVPVLADLTRARERGSELSDALRRARLRVAAAGVPEDPDRDGPDGTDPDGTDPNSTDPNSTDPDGLLLELADPDLADRRAAELRLELGGLTELLRTEAELSAISGERAQRHADHDRATAEQQAMATEVLRLSAVKDDTERSRTAAVAQAATAPAKRREVTRAEQLVAYVRQREEWVTRAGELADAERAAVSEHQRAQQAWLDLWQRRLGGMAAELASKLQPGHPCPVCGALEHPVPSPAIPGQVSDSAEKRARQTAERAERQRRAAESAARQAAEQLAAASARAGAETDLTTVLQGLEAAREEEAAARRAGHEAAGLGESAAAIERGLERAREQQEQAAAARAAAAEALAQHAAQHAELSARIERARGVDVDLSTRIRRLERAAAALAELATATRAHAAAASALARHEQAARDAATAAGFAGPEAAAAAILDPGEQAALLAAADGYDAALARIEGQLAALAAAGIEPARAEQDLAQDLEQDLERDLVAAQAALAAAVSAAETATGRLAVTRRAADALRQLSRAAEQHAAGTAPLRHRFRVLQLLSHCVEGTGGDNALRMRLSAYVLAARLEQVADAATRRLLAMSGGRYSLVHTDELVRGGGRSGLGLAVVDGWTGIRRDAASLSGGETFYASLSLALGLADVVQAEAGGTAIETLLVDEGFGSLDADTLDEVMDVLDGLRAGGRAVGLVSHLADLRDRVPTRLEVVKTRGGSRISQPLAG